MNNARLRRAGQAALRTSVAARPAVGAVPDTLRAEVEHVGRSPGLDGTGTDGTGIDYSGRSRFGSLATTAS